MRKRRYEKPGKEDRGRERERIRCESIYEFQTLTKASYDHTTHKTQTFQQQYRYNDNENENENENGIQNTKQT